MAHANRLLAREGPVWAVVAPVLFVVVAISVALEAGPAAFLAVLLITTTLVARGRRGDFMRLVAASTLFLSLGLAASVIPAAHGCGIPIVESAKHQMQPTPHIHSVCEQGNDRRGFAGAVLIIGSAVCARTARQRRRSGIQTPAA